ncbi:bifunctional phosphopantothenoylcysteine decarboxylase/phosphopantothenate--cysteine ligase CoaBC [Parasediminibacterium sp. JCM 36343]|uniref:bifunctional phosphopantothenoylcysteine decarboxylase/phosphopantothenate--cysteine ligase CoaBC n=1 Tax=Parasediminibacterium sp. JCM 36343 TaxID=3374279 RepID=UPI0039783988
MLAGKKILIGVSGSIAAYKTILLTRLFVKEGAEVKIVMTTAAKEFVSPLVLATLSKNKVLQDLATNDEWANHVQLGRWADVFVIVPLSCNTLAKMANGICDNLLMATYLSATCPIVVAPAMDEDMWHHPATKKNIATIKAYGNKVIAVKNGELASGLVGEGRVAEPEEILVYIKEHFCRTNEFAGKKVLITAGPTYEALDPVRFIGNHSSGKMGFALAKELFEKGADVTIVSGPSKEKLPYTSIKRIDVISANDMYNACMGPAAESNIIIMSAAVADYTPATVATEKVKKKEAAWQIELNKTKDILYQVGLQKHQGQFLVGFALETNNEKENALLKLKAKNADCIVLNSLRDEKAGFGHDTNKITLLHKSGEMIEFGLKSKAAVAKDIVSFILQKINE